MQLFIELIERATADGFEALEKRFVAVICRKDPRTARLLGCKHVRTPALDGPPTFVDCRFVGAGPPATNTVAVGKLIKTVKAQREVFRCRRNPDDFLKSVIVDMILFTELIEQKIGHDVQFVALGFEHVVCATFDIADGGTILGCGAFPVPTLP